MKRLCKILTACAALTLTSTTIKAQSCDARYPMGIWQTSMQGETTPKLFVNLQVWRDKDNCGDLTISEYETDKELFVGTLTYAGKEMKDDMPTGTYYFNVKTEQGKTCSISVNGSRDPVIIGTGELKDHPAFKADIVHIPGLLGGTGGEQFGQYCKSEKELLDELRYYLNDRRVPVEGFGNVRQYVNAHANLNPALPKYAKPKGAGAINIRAKASTTAEKVAELKPGETLLVIDEFDGWCQVKLGEDKTGWVSLSVITLTNTKGRTPAATTSFILGNGKLGPLSIGQTVESIPKSVPGLYDSFKYTKEEVEGNDMEDGYIAETCSFYKGGKNIFNAGASNKVLSSFVLLKGSEFIKTSEGIQVGYNARQLFQKQRMQWSTYYQGEVFGISGHFTYYVPSSYILGVDIPDKVSHFKVNAVVTRITYSEEQ